VILPGPQRWVGPWMVTEHWAVKLLAKAIRHPTKHKAEKKSVLFCGFVCFMLNFF
jgi:hypothetical protein